MGLTSNRPGGLTPTRENSSTSKSPTTSRSTQESLKGSLRSTEGVDAQSKLLEPPKDGSMAGEKGGDGVLEEAEQRLGTVKRNLQAELQAERLASLYDMPGSKTKRPPGQTSQLSQSGNTKGQGLDIDALVKRWNAQGIQIPNGPNGQATDRKDGKGDEQKGANNRDSTPAWNALVEKSPTIQIDSKKGSHRSPLGQGSEEGVKALLERLVFYMGLDEQRIGLDLGEAMKQDGIEKGSEKTAESHQATKDWEAKAEEEDPAWWENLLGAMGGAFAFAIYDYIAFNNFAFGQGGDKQFRYRLFQAPTQLFIHRWLSQHVSPAAAAAFDIIWWTWGCDLLFYALAEMGFGDGHSGTFETVAKGDITWASWTPLGIVAGVSNVLNGKKWTEPLDGTMLIVQSVIGFLVAAGVSFLSRGECKDFLDTVGLGWLEKWFQKNGMDLYVEITTSLSNPKLEGGLVYQPDEQTELHAGLGVDERGAYGTMGMQYLSEHRDWLLRVGLEIDKNDLRLYAAWQKKVADWNLFIEAQLGDEFTKLGGGAELRTDGAKLSGKVSWDSKKQWLASLKVSLDL